MSVEVTKPGKLPQPVRLEGRCSRCGCEVKCEEKDTKIVPTDYMADERQVKCPTPGCGGKITVDFPYNRTARR